MQRKIKILYNRIECIGAGACAEIAPNRWKMVYDEGKANLVDGKQTDSGQFEAILEVDEDQLKILINSADVCPVNVIHIIDLKTGEQLI